MWQNKKNQRLDLTKNLQLKKMLTLQKFQSQKIKIIDIARNYIQSIEDSKQVYFQHPQILVQLLNLDPIIFTDGQNSFECNNFIFPKNIKEDYNKNSIFKLKDWNCKIEFNNNSHYLNFEIIITNIELMENQIDIACKTPKLITNIDFKQSIESLKKKLLKKEYRIKVMKQDLTPYMIQTQYQIDNIQISYKKILDNQKAVLPSIFNKSQKFGLLAKNKSFKFTNELPLIHNQTRLNVVQNKIIKKNEEQLEIIQQKDQNILQEIKQQGNQLLQKQENNNVTDNDSSLEMYIKEKPKPQILDIESEDISIENCVKFKIGKKNKNFAQLYLKLWQEKLKRRDKNTKYMNLLVDEENEDDEMFKKQKKTKNIRKIDSSSSFFEIEDDESDQNFKLQKKKKKNNFSKDSIFNLNSIENKTQSDQETQLDEKPSFLKFIKDQINQKIIPDQIQLQNKNAIKQKFNLNSKFQKSSLIKQENQSSSEDEIFIFVKEKTQKKIKHF